MSCATMRTAPSLLRRLLQLSAVLRRPLARVLSSSVTSAPPLSTAPSRSDIPGVSAASDEEGVLIALFTCKVCDTRTARRVSKRAMRAGTVLVRCPGCLNLHVLADRLGFFDDGVVDAEALLRARGETVRRIGGGDASGADADVCELTEDDLRVLKSVAGAVRLRAASSPDEAAAGTGAAGEELPVATFEGSLTAKKKV